MKGFTGTLLEVNLSAKKITPIPLDMKIAEKFLGGAGYACATLFPLLSKSTDPLGPDNILFFMTGPLCGTLATSTGRMVVCAKSPYSGIWGESNCGTDACVQIKKAGYDGIIIKGVASSPVYLDIKDGKAELKDASPIWGKSIYAIHEFFAASEATKNARVLAIGPAGENLVRYAIIGSQERAFGRTGMGAVMGSKKLKAIVVQGTKKIEIAEPAAMTEFAKETNKMIMDVTTNVILQQLGTSNAMEMYNMTGELPIGYFRKPTFDPAEKISGAAMAEKDLKKSRHCFACPIGCGRIVSIGENTLGLPKGEFEGPEYETLAGFGSIILNGDLNLIYKANYLCNDLGLDTISTSSIMGFLMDLRAQNKISASDLDGIDLQWGKMEAVFSLLEKIASGKGIGKLLGQGSVSIGKHFKIDPEQIVAINNIEVTYHDMRAVNGMSLAYAISPHYGGSHNSCDMYMNALGIGAEDLGIIPTEAKENSPLIAETAARVMCHRAFYSSAIMCVFSNPPAATLGKYIELATGMKMDINAIRLMGERILDIKRLFNLKMGHTPKDEHIPKILLTPLPESGQAGNVPDFESLKTTFYKFLQWDLITGKPSVKKVEELGLQKFA